MPYPENLQIHTALTRFAVKLEAQPGGFLVDQLAPASTVPDQTGKFPIFGIEDFTDDTPDFIGGNSEPRPVDYEVSRSSYYCPAFEYFHFVSGLSRRTAEAPIKPEQRGVALMVRKQKIRQEKLFKTQLETIDSTTGQYATGATDFTKWNVAGADPLDDIESWKDSFMTNTGGLVPNSIVFCGDTARHFLHAAEVKAIIKEYRPDMLVAGGFPPVISDMKPYRPGVYTQTANLGQVTAPWTDMSMAKLWSSHTVYLLYVGPEAELETPTFIKRLRWIPPYTRSAPETHLGTGGTNYYTGLAQDIQITCSLAAFAAVSVVQTP